MSGALNSDVQRFVADVAKFFDTSDRGILDYVLSRMELPGWFHHLKVGLWLKLSSGLGEPWTRDGGIPQGCPLRKVFIVALYLPWRPCGREEGGGVGGGGQSLGFADNLKCVSSSDGDLLEAAWFTNSQLVGQSPAPDKCVLLGISSVGSVRFFLTLGTGGLSSWMLGTWEGSLTQLTVGELPLLLVVGGYSGCDGSSAELCW